MAAGQGVAGMSLHEHVEAARARRDAAYSEGQVELRNSVADTLERVAETIRAGKANLAILATAQNFCQRVQLSAEAQAGYYTLTCEGPEDKSSRWRLDAHLDGSTIPAGSFPCFDDAVHHVAGIYARRNAHFGIDRVEAGVFATRPFRVMRTSAAPTQ